MAVSLADQLAEKIATAERELQNLPAKAYPFGNLDADQRHAFALRVEAIREDFVRRREGFFTQADYDRVNSALKGYQDDVMRALMEGLDPPFKSASF